VYSIYSERITKLLHTFEISKPIFGIPSNYVATPRLVAEVSRVGGLGVIPAGFMYPEEIAAFVSQVREITVAPIGVELFAPQAFQNADEKSLALLDRSMTDIRAGYGLKPVRPIRPLNFEEQFRAVLNLNIPVLGVSLGGLREPYMEELEAKGVRTYGVASNFRDARVLRSSGVNAIVAKGWEAPGLLSCCEVPEEDSQIGSFTLFEECCRAMDIPVLACASILTQNMVRAALDLGISGIAITDALLGATEGSLSASGRTNLPYLTSHASRVTKLAYGRSARTLYSGILEDMQAAGIKPLPFPWQFMAMRDIYAHGLENGELSDAPIEFGQAAYLFTHESARSIVQTFDDWVVECL
jgi:nitronate monooxygenase